MKLSNFIKVNGKIFVDDNEAVLSESFSSGNIYSHLTEISKIAQLVKDMTSTKEDEVFTLGEMYIKTTEQIIELAKKLTADLGVYGTCKIDNELIDIRKKLILNVGALKRSGFGEIKYSYPSSKLFLNDLGKLTSDLDSITLTDIKGMTNTTFNMADMRMDHWDLSLLNRDYGVSNILELVHLMSSESFITKTVNNHDQCERIDRIFDTNYHMDCCEPSRMRGVSVLEGLSFLYRMIGIIKQQLSDMSEDHTALDETEKVLAASEKLLVAQYIRIIFALGTMLNNAMYNLGMKAGCEKYKEEIEAFLG